MREGRMIFGFSPHRSFSHNEVPFQGMTDYLDGSAYWQEQDDQPPGSGLTGQFDIGNPALRVSRKDFGKGFGILSIFASRWLS